MPCPRESFRQYLGGHLYINSLDQPLDVVRSLAHITSAKLSEYPALVILN